MICVAVVATVVLLADPTGASHVRCHTGDALGWATLRAEPQDVVYSMPGVFTDNSLYFESRYNCTRRNVLVRRLGPGVYEVLFPGLNPRAVAVSAVSEEGVAVSHHNLRGGVIRIALRGPHDIAFSIVVY